MGSAKTIKTPLFLNLILKPKTNKKMHFEQQNLKLFSIYEACCLKISFIQYFKRSLESPAFINDSVEQIN